MWGYTVHEWKLKSLCSIVPGPCIWKIVWIALSARPLEDGWYGAENMCTMPFSLEKAWNCSLHNVGPLSVIIFYGTPWVEKTNHNLWTVFSAVICYITSTLSGCPLAKAMYNSCTNGGYCSQSLCCWMYAWSIWSRDQLKHSFSPSPAGWYAVAWD